MDALTVSAASGLRARMESLDLLANNMANAGTAGYKADREFYNLYLAPEAAGNEAPVTLPVIERQWTDFSTGTLRSTGNDLDLALSSKGFFAVNGPSGTLYTRNGSFQVSGGNLVTTEGYPVRLAGGGALQFDPSRPLEVAADGSVKQNGQALGQLEIVDFSDPAAAVKVGRNYFRGPAKAAGVAQVQQGKLEDSNANPAESAVRLVSVMRQFEMLQKAVSMGGEMNRRAIEEVAKV